MESAQLAYDVAEVVQRNTLEQAATICDDLGEYVCAAAIRAVLAELSSYE